VLLSWKMQKKREAARASGNPRRGREKGYDFDVF
jgi:hypothetical protein